MEYLVTGGAGFIGSNIVHTLVKDGKSVRVLDNLYTGKLNNISEILTDIDFMEGDIRDEASVRKAVDGVKNVLHLAALPSVIRSVEDPLKSNDINMLGTLRMLIASRDAGVDRFVFSSSSSVYGDTPTLPKHEDMAPTPLSPYAVQKLSGEFYCRMFYKLYGLKTFSLRYFNIFGPRQDPSSQYSGVISLFVEALKNNTQPTIYGDGGQTRDFTFVDDVVRANLCCCDASENAAGDVYNVARGGRVSINDLFFALARIMKKDMKPVYSDPRAGDVRDSKGDTGRAQKALNWKSEVEFEEGLKRTVAYILNDE
ncbi:SDR family oxidoreductase [Verrucomicrobiota bacterium]